MRRPADLAPPGHPHPDEDSGQGHLDVRQTLAGDAAVSWAPARQSSPGTGGVGTARAAVAIPPRCSAGRPSQRRHRLHLVAGLLVILGVLLVAVAAHQLLWTNVQAGRAQDAASQELRDQWQRSPVAPATESSASGTAAEPPLGAGVALLRVPRLGPEYVMPVIEGTRSNDLTRGVGHYPGTALPGQLGNFAVAGHRSTYGQPFRDLDRLQPGDAVVVETSTTWFTYTVDDTTIVKPSQSEVLLPVPGQPDAQPTQRLLTLTTCHPRYSAKQRLIVHAHLTAQQDKTQGQTQALQG